MALWKKVIVVSMDGIVVGREVMMLKNSGPMIPRGKPLGILRTIHRSSCEKEVSKEQNLKKFSKEQIVLTDYDGQTLSTMIPQHRL